MTSHSFNKELATNLLGLVNYCPIIPSRFQPQKGILRPDDSFDPDTDKNFLCFPVSSRLDLIKFNETIQATHQPNNELSGVWHGINSTVYHLNDEDEVYAVTENLDFWPNFANATYVQLTRVSNIAYETLRRGIVSQRVSRLFTLEPALPTLEPLELVVLIPRSTFAR